MMAGHTLLKVIAGFAWTMVNISGIMFIVHFIPLLLLVFWAMVFILVVILGY